MLFNLVFADAVRIGDAILGSVVVDIARGELERRPGGAMVATFTFKLADGRFSLPIPADHKVRVGV